MNERDDRDQLEQCINAINAGRSIPRPADLDLAELCATVELVRSLPNAVAWPPDDFPKMLAARLSDELTPHTPIRPAQVVIPNGRGQRLPQSSAPADVAPPAQPSWRRQFAQFGGAVVAFGLLALVLTLVFRGSEGQRAPAASVPTARQIAYVGGVAGNADIFVINSDGSGQRNLTANAARDTAPAWSPDGTRIAFISNRDGNDELYVMNADGSDQRRLTNTPEIESAPIWSPDGGKIALVSSGKESWGIVVVGADGTRLREFPADTPSIIAPRWSPNGRLLVFGREANDGMGWQYLYVADVESGEVRQLSEGIGVFEAASWSPDGQSLAFTGVEYVPMDGGGKIGVGRIFVVQADGTNQRNVSGSSVEGYTPRWSGDGRQIAFWSPQYSDNATLATPGSSSAQVMELDAMNSDGTRVRRLTHAGGVVDSFEWSPDDTSLVAGISLLNGAGALSGRGEVRLVSADGADERVLVNDASAAPMPTWRPTGSTLSATPTSEPASPSPTVTPLPNTPTPTAASPTPDDSGIVRAATFDEAQALAPFPLVMPDPLPNGVTFGVATVNYAPQSGSAGPVQWGQVRDVTLFFGVAATSQNVRPPGIKLMQSTLRGGPPADAGTINTQETLGGKPVVKSLLKRDQGGDVLTYTWSTATIGYTVITVLRDGMTEELIAALVAATPLPEGASIVAPAPTVTLDGAATLSIGPDSGACNSAVVAIGKNFTPNSTVAIMAGGEGTEVSGGLASVLVGPDGVFSVALGKLPAVLGCGTAEAPASNARFVIRAVTADAQTGESVVGPTADAIFTYLGETRASLTLAPSFGTCDTAVTASGVNFTSGTTAAIYADIIGGGQPALVAETAIAEDGSFSVDLDVAALLGCGGQADGADAVYAVWAGPNSAGKQEVETPGRSAGAVFFATAELPAAVVNRAPLLFCGVELAPDGQFVGPNAAARACLRDARAQGGSGEMVTRAITAEGETVMIVRVNGDQPVEVMIATRAEQAEPYTWARESCSSVDVEGQQIGVSGCSEPEPLR